MEVLFTFRHVESSAALKEHTVERLQRVKKHFADLPLHVHVVFSAENSVEFSALLVATTKMAKMTAEHHSSDCYGAVDSAIDKLEAQARHLHSRRVEHHGHKGRSLWEHCDTSAERQANESSTSSS